MRKMSLCDRFRLIPCRSRRSSHDDVQSPSSCSTPLFVAGRQNVDREGGQASRSMLSLKICLKVTAKLAVSAQMCARPGANVDLMRSASSTLLEIKMT